ncbi:hypothetical protein Nepgr_010735 [Nepenthes gracilis]|uniref:Fungal lipase-like domain-containing protein n=1 Tax=Nepenthes gracilis TaxID=150966 RepID=A0AAD3XLL9_NEPGR|nr:hypothetical protein Nepgr_010735 [Nepenthes gracilis]
MLLSKRLVSLRPSFGLLTRKALDMKGGNGEDEAAQPSEREVFGISGPVHLTSVDWRLPDHRRSVAASLVQGVYILERDRQQKRQDSKALAPIWWDFFHFHPVQILVDKVDSSTYGAVFQYNHQPPKYCYPTQTHHQPPTYVIAFRGTVMKPDSRARDIKLDIQFVLNGLARCSRYQTALQVVQNLAFCSGPSSIWLVGHSLGAGIALQTGKTMARMGCFIETYLFNPPFAAPPLEKIKDQGLKDGIRIAGSFLTAGVTLAINGVKAGMNIAAQRPDALNHDPFLGLYSWVPYLFVNPSDPISSEYVGYFEHREKMVAMGAGAIGRIAAQNSILSSLSGAVGRDGEAPHLIPSAFVVTNLSVSEGFKQAHGIHQWWKPHPYWQLKQYQFR